jgi:hypothetical protein
MVHLAVHQRDESGREGGMVSWGEHVTDAEYGSAPDVGDQR